MKVRKCFNYLLLVYYNKYDYKRMKINKYYLLNLIVSKRDRKPICV